MTDILIGLAGHGAIGLVVATIIILAVRKLLRVEVNIKIGSPHDQEHQTAPERGPDED